MLYVVFYVAGIWFFNNVLYKVYPLLYNYVHLYVITYLQQYVHMHIAIWVINMKYTVYVHDVVYMFSSSQDYDAHSTYGHGTFCTLCCSSIINVMCDICYINIMQPYVHIRISSYRYI